MSKKIIIYQVLTRLFGNNNPTCKGNGSIEENGCGKFNDFTPQALQAIKKLGATHIWFTGVLEHATQTDYSNFGISKNHPAVVKGKAGSPYAIKDYYDVNPDLAVSVPQRMKEFEELIERTHKAGLKAIIDFVPNHVSRQYGSDNRPPRTFDFGEWDDDTKFFSNQNNFYYIVNEPLGGSVDWQGKEPKPYTEFPAKATGNDKFDANPSTNDWYETVKLNYGIDYSTGNRQFSPIPNTWVKMKKILEFWASKGVDGFRCDMAEMVPVEFWEWTIKQVKHIYKNIIFIAEVYQPQLYRSYIHRGGFDLLYDKEGLYDTLRAVVCGNKPASDISFCWQSVNDISQNMLSFLENHDEQRFASDFYAGNNGAIAIPAMIVCACLSKAPVMFYFGQELGERGMDSEGFSGRDGRTSIFDYWSIDTVRRWNNMGKFNEELLTEEEKELQLFYTKLFTVCKEEKAISEGDLFDITYANMNNPRFNSYKQFAFMRKKENEILLIVVNFDSIMASISLFIPKLAYEYLNIKETSDTLAHDLLSGKKFVLPFNSNQPVNIETGANNGVILKINLSI